MEKYLNDPQEIYRRSFSTVRGACDLSGLPPGIAEIALRMVHACAMPEIVGNISWRGEVAGSARDALNSGAPVLADCAMVAHGITRARLPRDNEVLCALDDPGVAEQAASEGTTRSAAAVDRWLPRMAGAVVVIGNAPTALYRLLEHLRDGAAPPAALFAFPVGFVGAAESKQALIDSDRLVPYITLRGRLGGSAIAVAAVNAINIKVPA